MGREKRSDDQMYVEDGTINLDAVTEATVGSRIDCRGYKRVTVRMRCTINTGAVTVVIQGSVSGIEDDDDEWDDVHSKTYTTTTGNDTYHMGYNTYYSYYRTKTITHSNSTITTKVAAR